MAHAEPGRQRHALAVGRVADPLVDELLGDRRRERAPVLAPDQMQHEIERRRAARAGEAVAVDLEELGGHLEIGVGLGEAGEVLPMQRAAVALEQAGAAST